MAVAEWRDKGLPIASAERLRQGSKSRAAIATLAKTLYAQNPDLLRNDTETARQIQKRNPPELRKPNGLCLGIEAIVKHLRAIRRHHTAAVEKAA
jgi:hypothetical protein